MVEDLQLGVESYQKKFNLIKLRTQDVDMSRRPAYTTFLDPQGVIYECKLKRKRFMRADELHNHEEEAIDQIGSAKDPHHDQSHQSKAAG
ncbi:hypothetical protein Tco_0710716 [Tanacetum coccineum]